MNRKIIVVGLLVCVMLVVAISPLGNYSVKILEIESQPVTIPTFGATVSVLETQNMTEDSELEDIIEEAEDEDTENTGNNESRNEEVIKDSELEDIIAEPEEPMGIEELLANAFNCSEDIIFTADSSYSLISEEFIMEFIETNDKNEEPRMPEIHDCDNFAMEFLMEIDAECALYEIVPAVGVIWVEENDADADDGHAVNFWINPEDESVWVFDPQTDEEYSLAGQVVVFVYL